MIWFTSDQHFGHYNIIKYCNRPFKSVRDMDYEIIFRYNSKVKPDDDVYMLGDFTMFCDKDTIKNYAKLLNGKKHIVIGNHDRIKNPRVYIECGFESVHYPYVQVKEFKCIHDYAMINEPCLCGHIHEKWLKKEGAYNVGVDMHAFYPININYIRENF